MKPLRFILSVRKTDMAGWKLHLPSLRECTLLPDIQEHVKEMFLQDHIKSETDSYNIKSAARFFPPEYEDPKAGIL